VNADTLARNLIADVGPGGQFLDARHTVQWLRKSLWRPGLLTRQNYVSWQESGSKDMSQRVREKVADIAAQHQIPPLPGATVEALGQLRQQRERAIRARAA
jgi:trimethylamine--corrinoid protein Co-methyltransferase